MDSQTAKLENINKFSKYGLRRRPTYQEIIGLLDENKKLGLPLPNRDATFFRNSPERTCPNQLAHNFLFMDLYVCFQR